MNIYKMKKEDIWKTMKEFTKTVYGKTAFLLSYIVFFFFFVYLIYLMITSLGFEFLSYEMIYFVRVLFCTLISFIIGSINYYHELIRFIDGKNR